MDAHRHLHTCVTLGLGPHWQADAAVWAQLPSISVTLLACRPGLRFGWMISLGGHGLLPAHVRCTGAAAPFALMQAC